jgi:hypothetical protein
VARGVAAGLHCLHDHGVVHRDLTPANVYLASGGGVLILDFGLARLLDRTAITAHGSFPGTRAYAAPEQFRGEADTHSDLYALGAVLYEMLTGRMPFVAENELELTQRVLQEDPESPSALCPAVPEWLDGLVLELLAKEPLQRPRGTGALLDALRDPHQYAPCAVRVPYDRSRPSLLAVRATGPSAGRAVVDVALAGAAPEISAAAITQPAQLDELHRARALGEGLLAVDTRVLDTATSGYGRVAALRGRSFLPRGPEPHTSASLRAAGEIPRVARGDIREQLKEGASLLRAPAFAIDSVRSEWLRRNPRLLDAALAARDALAPEMPLYAQVICTVEALAHRDDRLSIVNRFARGEPDGYWLGIAEVDGAAPEQLAAGLDLALLLQQLGAPCVWTLPGTLAELAWSLGVAGVEVALGRVGGLRLPTPTRSVRSAAPDPRFELPSLMTSLPAGLALEALERGRLPERECACPSCRRCADLTERLKHANEHNLWSWMTLSREIGELDATQRVERYRFRLRAAREQLALARKAVPRLRNVRHLALAEQTLALVAHEGILDTASRLRRVG